MSRRADRRYSAGFNPGYDYGSIPWDVRTVHGGDDDDVRNPGLSGCISASVIGYGDSVELTHRPRIRRRDRDWNRDRDRDGSSGIRSRASGDRSSFSDRERERLKQRMCLERNQSNTSSTTSSSYYHPRQQHHQARTRSLSLGRGYSYSSYSSADSEDGALERDDAWGSATVISPGRGYYHHERLSLSSPRVELADAGWPLASSRPASPPPSWHRPGRRDRYERGYVIDSRHGHDGLRFGMGPLGIDITEEPLPNPRVPSTRSTSYDRPRDGAARSRKAAASPAQSVRAAS
ncbi:hypothetical protein N656DRAFT_368276 [Canariomyces notabilis]|uniref:Uncharacterized protein n=1 Tax=Canariomyces notabilis TaxID=2074819 RepID=A0AAN6T980_9PEZI|nr:hypothetical protein N656DRAFT_368276 [Canariomyces arenarius]